MITLTSFPLKWLKRLILYHTVFTRLEAAAYKVFLSIMFAAEIQGRLTFKGGLHFFCLAICCYADTVFCLMLCLPLSKQES